jgi:Flp pilus assembly protein TadB
MEDRFRGRNRGVYGLIIFLIGAVVTHALILWATQSPKIAAFGLCGIIVIALILTKWRNSNLPPN